MTKILAAFAEKCVGCKLCELACSIEKEGHFVPTRSRISVVPFTAEGLSFPVVCHQCQRAPCSAACPRGAITRNPRTGAVTVDKYACNLCGICVAACPFGMIAYPEDGRYANKCDLCGGEPACVAICPTGALKQMAQWEVALARRVRGAEDIRSNLVELPAQPDGLGVGR